MAGSSKTLRVLESAPELLRIGKMGADSELEPSDFLDGTFQHIPSGEPTESY